MEVDDNATAVTQDVHFSRICKLQHRLESCTQEEAAVVLQEACEDLVREVDVAKEDAETIWACMVRHNYANKKAAHCKSILEIWQPGGPVERKPKARANAEDLRRRHLKSIVLDPTPDKSDNYEWHKWGYLTLAALSKIATTLQSWDVFVQWANCVMIQRHDIVDHHRGIIGNTWSTSSAVTASTLQPADVSKIADVLKARGPSPVTEQRIQEIEAWVSPCPKLLSADRLKFAFGNKAVEFDQYGLLRRKEDVGRVHICDEHCMEREANKARIDSDEASRKKTQEVIEEKKQRAQQNKREVKQKSMSQRKKTRKEEQLRKAKQTSLDGKKAKQQEGAARQQANGQQPQNQGTVPLSGNTTTRLQSGDSVPRCNEDVYGPVNCIECSGYCKLCAVPKAISDQVKQEMSALAHNTAKYREVSKPKLGLWLEGLTFAAIHDTAYTGIVRQSSLDAADVVMTTAATFRQWGKRGDTLSKPVIIRGDHDNYDDNYDVDEQNEKRNRETFAQTLRLPYTSKVVSVAIGPGRTPKILPREDVLERLEEASEWEEVQPWSLTILGDIPQGYRSSVQSIERFGLIDQLVLRKHLGNHGQQTVQTLGSPRDVQDRQAFQKLSFEGAFSGVHLDVLRGTWRNNLFGLQLWWIVPRSSMTEQDWSDLSRDGDSWDPRRKGRAIVLRPGDTLVLNDRVVHASLAVRTSAMKCGSFWDSGDMPALINDLQWLACNPKPTQAPQPLQVSVLLSELLEIASEDPQALREKQRPTQTLDALHRYFEDGCDCAHCDELCWCRQRGIRCTSRCFKHPENWFKTPASKGKKQEDRLVCMAEGLVRAIKPNECSQNEDECLQDRATKRPRLDEETSTGEGGQTSTGGAVEGQGYHDDVVGLFTQAAAQFMTNGEQGELGVGSSDGD